MDLTALLQVRFAERRARNRRYSLRAFARDLALSHGALSQLMHRRRPTSSAVIRSVGPRLGLEAARIEALVGDEHERKLRASLRGCLGTPRFEPSVRRLAARTGLPMDAVCIALQRLLVNGSLTMSARTTWVLATEEP
jgi:DNA-binding IclR family transcriptional regulator